MRVIYEEIGRRRHVDAINANRGQEPTLGILSFERGPPNILVIQPGVPPHHQQLVELLH